MDGISASSASRARDYDFDEVEALRKDDSTSDIMNKVRHDADANYTKDVFIRGDDKSSKELREEFRNELTEHAAETAGHLALHQVPELVEAGIVAGAATSAAVVIGGVAIGAAFLHAVEQGEKVNAARDKDESRLAMLASLHLPKGFMTQEGNRCDVASNNGKAGRYLILEALEGKDHKYKAVLQMHCDRGQHAALEVLKSGTFKPGMSAEQLLKERPNVYAAYAKDAAFRAGFDGLLWAKQHDPAEFDAAVKALGSRDAAYAKNHVRVQG
ncbi:MAG: hypothetical protein U0174_06555 [Polyangiaceae bacterium]